MSTAEEHAAAIAALDQSEMGGRTIYVSESLPKDKIADKKKRDTPKKRKWLQKYILLYKKLSYVILCPPNNNSINL